MNDNSSSLSEKSTDGDLDEEPSKEDTIRVNQSPLAFDDGTTPSTVDLTPELFERYRQKVFTARPNFKTINETSGSLPLYDYLRRQVRENRNKIIKKRKGEFIEVVGEETKRLLGSQIAESTMRQLKDNNTVSTIQHSAPLSHPYVLSSTLQNALPSFGSNHPALRNTIILSCANVSFNNYKFPRGHVLHTFGKGIQTHLLTLFGHTADARPVIHHPPYHHSAIIDIKNRIQGLKREGSLSDDETTRLIYIFEEFYMNPHALSANNYHDQLTITNHLIFKKMFENYEHSVPDLIFLSQEKIALSLLEKYHLTQDSIINKILFDPQMQARVYKYFDGLNGAFSTEKEYGTFFFWALPKASKYREQLWLKEGYLQTHDCSYKVAMHPEAIAEAIGKNELIPNTLLTFILLAFYYGQYLGGGPAQTLNLTRMKEAYLALMQEAENEESLEATKEVNTTNLIISRPTFAFIDIPKKDMRIPATGLDLLMYSDRGKSWDKIIEATKRTTLSQFFNRALESFYAEFVPPNDKEPILTQITERDIEKFTGLDSKIPPMITF